MPRHANIEGLRTPDPRKEPTCAAPVCPVPPDPPSLPLPSASRCSACSLAPVRAAAAADPPVKLVRVSLGPALPLDSLLAGGFDIVSLKRGAWADLYLHPGDEERLQTLGAAPQRARRRGRTALRRARGAGTERRAGSPRRRKVLERGRAGRGVPHRGAAGLRLGQHGRLLDARRDQDEARSRWWRATRATWSRTRSTRWARRRRAGPSGGSGSASAWTAPTRGRRSSSTPSPTRASPRACRRCSGSWTTCSRATTPTRSRATCSTSA